MVYILRRRARPRKRKGDSFLVVVVVVVVALGEAMPMGDSLGGVFGGDPGWALGVTLWASGDVGVATRSQRVAC